MAEAAPDDAVAAHNAGAAWYEAGDQGASLVHLSRSIAVAPTAAALRLRAHVRAVSGDVTAAVEDFRAVLALEPSDADAHWGLYEVLQLVDREREALAHQRRSLAIRSLRTIPARQLPAVTTILELCIAGSFQANIPLDFILDLNRTTVHKLFLGEHPIPPLPSYDLVFNTIADAPNAQPALVAARTFIDGQARPVLNSPDAVPLTSRDAIAVQFARSQSVCVARTRRVDRGNAHEAATHLGYPVLIRPLDSHAGNHLAKLGAPVELETYLAATAHADEFYLSEFIDYRSGDGYFRKYRIMFVDGDPYPVHLAISPNWMIHYYNAAMADHAWMRDEEHAFMRDLPGVFDGLRAEGLREIARALPLDYFGIDCSIAPDGRVLLFEASTAMIVHLRDPIDLYPYKHAYVPRIIRALEELFARRLGRPVLA